MIYYLAAALALAVVLAVGARRNRTTPDRAVGIAYLAYLVTSAAMLATTGTVGWAMFALAAGSAWFAAWRVTA